MDNTYRKARIQLLNGNDQPIGDVEIISNCKEIFYNNNEPLLQRIGKYKEGTTFDKESLSSIIDSLLYTEIYPEITEINFSNNDNIDSNLIIKPKGSIIEKFNLITKINFGSYKKLNICLDISSSDGTIYQQSKSIVFSNNINYTVIFEIPTIYKDCNITILVLDSENNELYKSETITYKFISPVYVGWVNPIIINTKRELDKYLTKKYLQELIDHNSNNIDIRYNDISNQLAYIPDGINFNTKEYLNPFILIPQSWGELKRINDTNGNNIINSYCKLVGVDINTHDSYSEKYIAYVSRQSFYNSFKLIESIEYISVDNHNEVNMDDIQGENSPLLNGYSMQFNTPIDDRFYKKTYRDLLETVYPYPGLMCYVEDINTTFRYEKGVWKPTCIKTHIVENETSLTAELGGWDDVAILATPGGTNIGSIWKKRYNNKWERYGDLKFEDIYKISY